MIGKNAEETIEIAAQVLEYMGSPTNAFGIWVIASGLIAGAYLLSPALLTTL